MAGQAEWAEVYESKEILEMDFIEDDDDNDPFIPV
jgi:hypothetical protein